MKPRLLFITVICLVLSYSMTSCSSYTGERTSAGCGVWYKKKFTGEGKVWRQRNRGPKFGR